jgi:hypothetical protein
MNLCVETARDSQRRLNTYAWSGSMTFYVEALSIAREAESQVRRIGHYQSLRDALVAAERAISEFLLCEFQPGMLPSTLFSLYQSHGEVPYIFRDDGEVTMNLPGFNHFRYALARCAEICQYQRYELQ